MTLDELYLIQKAVRYQHLSDEEYLKAEQIVMREIELKIMNPIISKEEDRKRRNNR